MKQEKKDKLVSEGVDFILSLYKLQIIEKDMDENRWFGAFAPPYFVLFLNYLHHFYYEVSKSDIDELSKNFIDKIFYGKQELTDKMISTNKDIDSLINTFRSKGLDYGSSWALCFFAFFGLKNGVERSVDIEKFAYDFTQDRRIIKPQLEAQKQSFFKIAKQISDACKQVCESRNFHFLAEDFDALGLFCTKWFVKYEYSTELVTGSEAGFWMSRDFVTQYFIMSVIGLFGTRDTGYNNTRCFSIWNFMNGNTDIILSGDNRFVNALCFFMYSCLSEADSQDKSKDVQIECIQELDRRVAPILNGSMLSFK